MSLQLGGDGFTDARAEELLENVQYDQVREVELGGNNLSQIPRAVLEMRQLV